MTKGEILAYYRDVAPLLLPHLAERPLMLERYPEGISGPSFYQKDAPTYFPAWLRTHPMTYRHGGGKVTRHPLVTDAADLLYLVNLGTLTFHTFLSRIADLAHPDILVIDVDPPEGGDSDPFAQAVAVARLVREALLDEGMDPLVKTSGKRGLHLALPLDRSLDYEQVRGSLTALFDRLIARHPDLLTREMRLERRGPRVYLDAHRMALGATVVPAYVVRPTPEATVSTPVTWEELDEIAGASRFTVRTVLERFAAVGDLWQTLTGIDR